MYEQHTPTFCNQCYSLFNSTDHLPLIIPTCGHTLCSSCIQSILSKCSLYEPFICPQDKLPMTLTSTDISQFPKNFLVMKKIESLQTTSSIMPPLNFSQQIDDLKISTIIHPVSGDLVIEKNYSVAPDMISPLIGQRVTSSKNFSRAGISISRYDNPYKTSLEANMCPDHGKKMEFVCLNHQCRVCPNCALVGAHKNHDIKSAEEIFKEIDAKTDRLSDLFQSLDREQTAMPEEQFSSMYGWKIQEKQRELEGQVTKKFEELRTSLRLKEEKILSEIRTRIGGLDSRLKSLNQFPVDLQFKIQFWKDSAQALIYTASEKIDKGEIVYELLETKSIPKPDLIKEGDELVRESSKYKASPLPALEKELKQLTLSFNDNLKNQIEGFCTFQTSQIEDKSPKKNPSTVDLRKTGIGSPTNPGFTTAKTMNDNQFSGYNTNYTTNYNSPGMSDLASFGYKDSMMSPGSGTHVKVSRIDVDAVYNPQDDGRGRSQRTPRQTPSKSPSNKRSVSPGGRTIQVKERMKLKVADKFEGVIEGIKADKIEVADLFDAELGDNGVCIIAEYLRGNTKLKTLKLVKNKITDEGAVALIDALSKNNSIENLHLSQNLLTDKAIDAFADFFKRKTNIRTIFFNRNSVNLSKVKSKVKEIQDMGINISI